MIRQEYLNDLPTTMTQERYHIELSSYIKEQMMLLPEGKKSLSFWTNFNREKKQEFDDFLSGAGVIILNE